MYRYLEIEEPKKLATAASQQVATNFWCSTILHDQSNGASSPTKAPKLIETRRNANTSILFVWHELDAWAYIRPGYSLRLKLLIILAFLDLYTCYASKDNIYNIYIDT
jgi:hypothetical protein